MSCLMLVKSLEFPVNDEEKSDRVFKELSDEDEAQYDLLEYRGRSLSTGELQ
jgi:hypothetical protein